MGVAVWSISLDFRPAFIDGVTVVAVAVVSHGAQLGRVLQTLDLLLILFYTLTYNST